MKWETVKTTVGREVRTAILNGQANDLILVDLIGSDFAAMKGTAGAAGCSHHAVTKLYADKAWEVIQNWDIRCVGKLRELFPAMFPKSLGTGPLVADMDESGDWVVLKA